MRAAGATIVASGTAAAEIAGAAYVAARCRRRRRRCSRRCSPSFPGQLFAGALARAKGLDPDQPRGLSKVTLAL